MEIEEYMETSSAYSYIEKSLAEERAHFEKICGEVLIMKRTINTRRENNSTRRAMFDKGLYTQEEYDGAIEPEDDEYKNYVEKYKRSINLMRESRAKVRGLQSEIDQYLEQAKSSPEVAQVATELKEKKHKEKLEQFKKAKKRAEDKKEIIEKIKNNPDAQQNLEEILKLGKRITELNAIVNDKDVDKNSQEYIDANEELKKIVPDIKAKKLKFAEIVGDFNEDKKQMTEEVLEDLLKGEAKVGKDGKILVTDMLAERIEKEGQNIGNAERGIEFNENRIQEITGKAPRQAENQGQENLEQEEQEQPKEPKKPGFFKKFKNFLRQLFAKEALLTPGNPERKGQVAQEGKSPDEEKVSREEQQRAAKKAQEFIEYLRANPEDPLLTKIAEPGPMEPVHNQEQKKDDHRDRE